MIELKLNSLFSLLSKFEVGEPSECWLWNGYVTSRGYGKIHLPAGMLNAHRLVYQIAKGKIPPGLQLDHLCRNRRCVNPFHLEVVTNRENIVRSPITVMAVNRAKTHCPKGHSYFGDNLYARANGRGCRICRNIAARDHKRRKRGFLL